MVSELDRLRRAFVCLLPALARKYQVKVLGLTRDSLAAVLEKAYRRVILKCHPDKGGSGVDQVRLNDARDLWKAAARAPRARERPPPAAGTMALPGDARRRTETPGNALTKGQHPRKQNPVKTPAQRKVSVAISAQAC